MQALTALIVLSSCFAFGQVPDAQEYDSLHAAIDANPGRMIHVPQETHIL